MVQAVRRRAGDAGVVAALADLRRFLPAYQDAAPTVGRPPLRDETAAEVHRLRA